MRCLYNIFLPMNLTELLFFLGLLLLVSPTNGAQCCRQLRFGQCIDCPSGMHLYRGNCLFDVYGCLSYHLGFDCQQCREGFTLRQGRCKHERIDLELLRKAKFEPYLEQSLGVDPGVEVVLAGLVDKGQLWVNWYEVALARNRTVLNQDTLRTNALAYQEQVLGTNNPPKYIYRARLAHSTRNYTAYRLTYSLTHTIGFGQVTAVAQTISQGEVNYVELSKVRIQQIKDSQYWKPLVSQDPNYAYILLQINRFFPIAREEDFLQGWSKIVEKQSNFTLFYEDSQSGVQSYHYYAHLDQLPRNPTTHPLEVKQKQQQIQQKNKEQEKQVKTIVIGNNDSSSSSQNDASGNLTNKTRSSPTSDLQYLDMSELDVDPVLMTGYSVAMQYLPAQARPFRLFKTTQEMGIIFRHSPNISTFTFSIYDRVFEVKGIQTVNEKQWEQLQQVEPDTVDATVDQAQHKPKKNRQKSRQTSGSSNQEQPQSSSNQPSRQNSGYLHSPLNNSESSFVKTGCGVVDGLQVDVTDGTVNDIFIPQINLYLRRRYKEKLQDSKIMSAKYRWGVTNQHLISNITYEIVYSNAQKAELLFTILINQKNEIKVLHGGPKQTITPSTLPAETDHDEEPEKQVKKPDAKSDESIAQPQTEQVTAETQRIAPSELQIQSVPKEPEAAIASIEAEQQPQVQEQPQRRMVSQSEYTSDRKYSSLLRILQQMYSIPRNSTVLSMYTWEGKDDIPQYQVKYTMNYSQPLPDGSELKLTTYLFGVEPPFSFVKMHSRTEENIKHSDLLPTETPRLQVSLTVPPVVQSIMNDMKRHSRQLENMRLAWEPAKEASIQINGHIRYQQILTFESSEAKYCFQVDYSLKQAESTDPWLHSYQLISCGKPLQTLEENTSFKDLATSDEMINLLKRISLTDTIDVEFIRQKQGFKWISFTTFDSRYEVVMTIDQQLIVSYSAQNLPIYHHGMDASPTVESILQQVETHLVQKGKSDPEVLLINNTLCDKWSSGILEIYAQSANSSHHLTAKLDKPSTLTITQLTSTDRVSVQGPYKMELKSQEGWGAVPWSGVPSRDAILKILQDMYPSFMVNTEPISVLAFPQKPNSRQEGQQLKVGLLKKFSASYSASYIVSVRVKDGKVEVLGLQNLPMNQVTVRGCTETNHQALSPPYCKTCEEGRRLESGACQFQQIKSCRNSYKNTCLDCQLGYTLSSKLDSCRPNQEEAARRVTQVIMAYSQPASP